MSSSESKSIQLIIKSQDGNKTRFRLSRLSKLQTVMDAYCQRISRGMDSIRFLCDGDIVLDGNLTPNDLRMEDGEEIEAIIIPAKHNRVCLYYLCTFCVSETSININRID